jgi:hypothetical protein
MVLIWIYEGQVEDWYDGIKVFHVSLKNPKKIVLFLIFRQISDDVSFKNFAYGFRSTGLVLLQEMPCQRIYSNPMYCIIICKNTFLIVTYCNSTGGVRKSNTTQNPLYAFVWLPYSQASPHMKNKREQSRSPTFSLRDIQKKQKYPDHWPSRNVQWIICGRDIWC